MSIVPSAHTTVSVLQSTRYGTIRYEKIIEFLKRHTVVTSGALAAGRINVQ